MPFGRFIRTSALGMKRHEWALALARLNPIEPVAAGMAVGFATLLQDANVDPLIRRQVMGHKLTNSTKLRMTADYTHTRPETLCRQGEQALRRWPESPEYAGERLQGR